MKSYVVWDRFENLVHCGPWTKKECLGFMSRCRKIMPRPEGCDEVFEIRKVRHLKRIIKLKLR